MKQTKPWTNKIEELSTPFVEVYKDVYAVTPGHLLFVPADDTRENVVKAFHLAQVVGDGMLLAKQCDGYNIGLNRGEAAGQTCSWSHVHLIPRQVGDMDDPTGGIRHVIPSRGNYKISPQYEEVRNQLRRKDADSNKQ